MCVDPSRSFPAGRVAFIDFGIVGAIPAATAEGMLDFVRSFPAGDMAGVGRALEKMGFTKELSEEQSAAFAKDIGEVIASIDSMTADIATTASAGAAASAIDETQLNRAVAAVARVAEGCRILAALAMHCILAAFGLRPSVHRAVCPQVRDPLPARVCAPHQAGPVLRPVHVSARARPRRAQRRAALDEPAAAAGRRRRL